MKSALSALALVIALAIPTSAQTQQPPPEQRAAIIAATAVLVPAYCPGLRVDMMRYRALIASTGVSEARLRESPLSDAIKAMVDYFPDADGNNGKLCATIAQTFGPIGNGMVYPR